MYTVSRVTPETAKAMHNNWSWIAILVVPQHWISQSTNTVMHSWQQSSRQSDASSQIWSCNQTNSTSYLRYHGIHLDRMLTYRHVETTALKHKKGLSVLKAMPRVLKKCLLFLLYPGVVAQCHWLGLTTMTQTNLLKLDWVQNKDMQVILETTKDIPTETMFHAIPPTNANLTESGAGQSILQSVEIPTAHSMKLWKIQMDADWGMASFGQVKQRTQYRKYASWRSSSKPTSEKGIQIEPASSWLWIWDTLARKTG